MLDQKNRLIDKLIDTKIRSQRDAKTAQTEKKRKAQIDTKRGRKIDTCMHIYTYLLNYLNTHVVSDSRMGQRGSPSQGSSMWGVCGCSLPRAGLVPIPYQ